MTVAKVGRRQSRRTALFLLYQWDLTGQPMASLYDGTPDDFALQLAEAIAERTPALDAQITAASDAWSADRLGTLERNVLLTVLSRVGANSRVVLTHDVAQRDNLRVGRYDGVVAVVEKLKGHPLFAHVTLTRSERSPIAALVTEMLEDISL